MKMMMQKELSVNLQMNLGMPVTAAAHGSSAKPEKRGEPKNKDFSRTLSAELDKTNSVESQELKEKEKQNAGVNEKEGLSGRFMGLAVGVTIEQPVNGVLASPDTFTESASSPLTISMESTGNFNALPQETKSVSTQAHPGTVQFEIGVATEKTEFPLHPETVTQKAIDFAPSVAKSPSGTVGSASGAFPESLKDAVLQSTTAVDGTPAFVSSGAALKDEAVIKPEPFPDVRTTMEAAQVPRDQETKQMNPHPQILQDIISVKVSQTSQTANLPKPSVVPAAENVEVSNEIPQEALIGAVEDAVGNFPAETKDGELSKESWAQLDSELFQKTELAPESSVFTPPAFDKVLNAADHVSAPNLTVPSLRQDLQDVVRQVMEGGNLSVEGVKTSQVIITLKPEHLGQVTVRINVDGDRITAAFHAASSEVRAVLESSLPQLRQEMTQQGWNFDSGGVFGGMQEFLANHQDHRQQAQQQQMIHFSNRIQRDEYEDIVAFNNKGRLQVLNAAEIDYRI